MNLVRCQKCGTVVLTQETLQERLTDEKEALLAEIEKLANRLLRCPLNLVKKLKAEKHAKTLRVGQINALIKQLNHQIREERREFHEILGERAIRELKALGYSGDQLRELNRQAEAEHEQRTSQAAREIERIYGQAEHFVEHSEWRNAYGNYDPTAKKALDRAGKGEASNV